MRLVSRPVSCPVMQAVGMSFAAEGRPVASPMRRAAVVLVLVLMVVVLLTLLKPVPACELCCQTPGLRPRWPGQRTWQSAGFATSAVGRQGIRDAGQMPKRTA